MILPALSFNFASTLLLAGAATAASIGGNVIANLLRSTDRPSAWAQAIAFACMTAAIGIAAIHHDPAMTSEAVGVCFSSSVAAMTLGLGVVLVVANRAGPAGPVSMNRSASMLLPVALLVQLIGFSGKIQPKHAAMLVVEGIALAPLCIQWSRPRRMSMFGILQLMLSIGLIALAGWAAVISIADLATRSELFRPEVSCALVLGPVIVLPMIPMLATMAEIGLAATAIETIILFVLLNFCIVLPLLCALQPNMAIPLLSWRLDSLLLVAIGLLLLPPSIGRWTLGKREGTALVACFVMYLMVTLIITLG